MADLKSRICELCGREVMPLPDAVWEQLHRHCADCAAWCPECGEVETIA